MTKREMLERAQRKLEEGKLKDFGTAAALASLMSLDFAEPPEVKDDGDRKTIVVKAPSASDPRKQVPKKIDRSEYGDLENLGVIPMKVLDPGRPLRNPAMAKVFKKKDNNVAKALGLEPGVPKVLASDETEEKQE